VSSLNAAYSAAEYAGVQYLKMLRLSIFKVCTLEVAQVSRALDLQKSSVVVGRSQKLQLGRNVLIKASSQSTMDP
jgi:hypothetical protein